MNELTSVFFGKSGKIIFKYSVFKQLFLAKMANNPYKINIPHIVNI